MFLYIGIGSVEAIFAICPDYSELFAENCSLRLQGAIFGDQNFAREVPEFQDILIEIGFDLLVDFILVGVEIEVVVGQEGVVGLSDYVLVGDGELFFDSLVSVHEIGGQYFFVFLLEFLEM